MVYNYNLTGVVSVVDAIKYVAYSYWFIGILQ